MTFYIIRIGNLWCKTGNKSKLHGYFLRLMFKNAKISPQLIWYLPKKNTLKSITWKIHKNFGARYFFLGNVLYNYNSARLVELIWTCLITRNYQTANHNFTKVQKITHLTSRFSNIPNSRMCVFMNFITARLSWYKCLIIFIWKLFANLIWHLH